MKVRDLSNQKFGFLTILNRNNTHTHKGVYWNCICDCGNICVVHSRALVSGHTKSCGCLSRYVSSLPKTHGLSSTPEHAVWKAMRQRCNNKRASNYNRYGGRGIKICPEWDLFENFYNWCKKSGYKIGLTIDRINNDGDYSPENCRWSDKITQGNNKSNNNKILYKGDLLSVNQLSRLSGIERRTISYRIKKGWNPIDIVNVKPKYGNRIKK